MIAAREMGMNENEFWNSCPFFFQDCYIEYQKRQAKKYGK